ncbi:nucleotidyltransferase family protein [Rufibacter roseus]|uniref:NTP transferase domain-containing protein n=1 Tax=Rufibacter roseus TaxID=1567108 RepID=A0ABW2DRL4_9BACT|nr:nucleotidyltransferase family protein [Rufibacter roseus]
MVGVIILAAGASTRLGQPKQNLMYLGQTLLQRAVSAAAGIKEGTVLVVSGANSQAVLPQLESLPVHHVHNPEWATGMGSSIWTGVQELLNLAPTVSGVILMLCDQPFVSAEILQQLLQAQQHTGKGIVACAYQNTLGAPVLFTRPFFSELKQLQGQDGAKKLLKQHAEEVAAVPFELGAIDIDTPQEFAALQHREPKV